MSDYPMLISNKLHSFRNFTAQSYAKIRYISYLCDINAFINEKKHNLLLSLHRRKLVV